MCHCHSNSKNYQKYHFQKRAATKTTHWPQKLHHLQTIKSCHKRRTQQSNFPQISQPWRHLKPLDLLTWTSLQCRTVSSALYCKHYLLFGWVLIQPQIRKSWDSMENANKKKKVVISKFTLTCISLQTIWTQNISCFIWSTSCHL